MRKTLGWPLGRKRESPAFAGVWAFGHPPSRRARRGANRCLHQPPAPCDWVGESGPRSHGRPIRLGDSRRFAHPWPCPSQRIPTYTAMPPNRLCWIRHAAMLWPNAVASIARATESEVRDLIATALGDARTVPATPANVNAITAQAACWGHRPPMQRRLKPQAPWSYYYMAAPNRLLPRSSFWSRGPCAGSKLFFWAFS